MALSSNQIRARRQKAVALFRKGMSQAEVARRCGVSATTAMRWRRAWVASGKKHLEPKQRGRPTKLSGAQFDRIERELVKGPQAHGWSTDLWTLERVGKVIERVTGVHYHPGHIWRILRRLGWSLQRPTTRARERDEAEILRWKKRVWPRLKKRAARSSSSTRAASRKVR